MHPDDAQAEARFKAIAAVGQDQRDMLQVGFLEAARGDETRITLPDAALQAFFASRRDAPQFDPRTDVLKGAAQ